jgi:hypothetical protein
VQRGEGVSPVGDLLFDAVELLLLRGGRLVGAPAHLGGLLLRLGVQRNDLLARGVAPLLDLALDVAAHARQLLLRLRLRRLGVALDLRVRALDERLGLGAGVPQLLGGLLAEPLGLLLGPVAGVLRFDAGLLGMGADLGQLHLGSGAALLVRLVLVRAAGAELGFELLAHLLGALAGVGERLLGVGLAAGRALGAARHDLARLLLGQCEDLVDHRPEVAERRLVELDRRPLAQFAQFGLELLQLGGHGLHLAPGALPLRVVRRQFGVDARHVLVDLALVVAPHHEVELRPLTAVGHAPSTLPAQPRAQRYRHRPADRHPRPGASFRRETARSSPVCGG